MSNINPQNIDGTYPIAGQDNNSQGFRDNFTNTINNFTFAAAELTDLQQKAVLKAALGSVGQTGTPTNDMNYAFLTHAQLIGTVETKDNIGSISSGSNFEVDWETGHFQTVSITTTAGMTFTNWPSSSSVWSRLRLQITATTLSNLTISGTYIENLQNIQGASGNVLTLNTGVYQFDFSITYDGGTTGNRAALISSLSANFPGVSAAVSSVYRSSVTLPITITPGTPSVYALQAWASVASRYVTDSQICVTRL